MIIDLKRKLLVFPLVTLITVGVFTIVGNEKTLENVIKASIFYVGPLFIILWSLIKFEEKKFKFYPTLFVLIFGSLGEYGYYSYEGPSRAVMLIISLPTYWLFSLITLYHGSKSIIKNESESGN